MAVFVAHVGRGRRVAGIAFGALGLLLVGAGAAGAQALVDVQPTVVQAGATVSVTGVRGFASGPAIEVHLDDPTGPVLATSPSAASAFGPIQVTIPAGTPAGPHVLVITQALRRTDAGVRGLPARAAAVLGLLVALAVVRVTGRTPQAVVASPASNGKGP